MQGLSFLEQLDRVGAGTLDPESVLSPFLSGLEAMVAELEQAVDAGVTPALARLFDALSERFQETHNLACDLLENPVSGGVKRLRQSHARLEQSLLAFHEASWIERGPTAHAWANQVVEGLEWFLEGEPLASDVGTLLDAVVLACEKRGAAREAGPGRDLLSLLRPLADWARGSIPLTPAELRESLRLLPKRVERAEQWLQEAQARGLERLLGSLDGNPSAEEVLMLARATLAEVERQIDETQQALSQTYGKSEVVIGEVFGILSDLEHTLRSLIEDVEGGWEWDFRDQLRELCQDLAEHMQELERVSQTEGAAECLACGGLNARQARRCAHCSVLLPAPAGEEALLDLTVGDAEAPEGENVRRLRVAVQAFAEGRLQAETLQSLASELRSLSSKARQAAPARATGTLRDDERAYLEALDGIDRALEALQSISHPQEASLWPSLDLFLLGARQLRELREPVA